MGRVPAAAQQPVGLESLHEHVQRLGGHPEFSSQVRGGELALSLECFQDRVLRQGQTGRAEDGIQPGPDRVLGPPQLDQEISVRRNSCPGHPGCYQCT